MQGTKIRNKEVTLLWHGNPNFSKFLNVVLNLANMSPDFPLMCAFPKVSLIFKLLRVWNTRTICHYILLRHLPGFFPSSGEFLILLKLVEQQFRSSGFRPDCMTISTYRLLDLTIMSNSLQGPWIVVRGIKICHLSAGFCAYLSQSVVVLCGTIIDSPDKSAICYKAIPNVQSI